MSSSDSDTEFFDAREEITSPKSCIKTPVFDDILQEAVSSDSNAENELASPVHAAPEEQKVYVVDDDANDDVPDSSPPQVNECATNSQPQPPMPIGVVQTDIVKSVSAAATTDADVKLPRQPDLLACVQERPTNLPGVTPVLVVESEPDVEEVEASDDKVEKTETSAGDAVVVADCAEHKSVQPSLPLDPPVSKKKVPPPRPTAPPKRPPPPKRHLQTGAGRPGKPYLSEVDDGLLTPNSTVDNLTREFTEALNQATAVDKSKQESSVVLSHCSGIQNNRTSLHDESGNRSSNPNARPSPSNSLGRKDAEILSSVIVRNLDTGESMPLSAAAEQVSQCLNPLALQIMSRTKEFSYAGSTASTNSHESQMGPVPAIMQSNYADSDSVSIASDDIDIGKDAPLDKRRNGGKKVKKSKKFKKMMGKGVTKVKVVAGNKVEKAVQKVKNVKEEVMHTETLNVSSDEDSTDLSSSAIKVKASSSNKGPYQFAHLKQVQDIAVHVGAVWCMKFSHCGRLLATAGQDNVIWVWVLKDFYNYFNDMRNKYDSQDELLSSSMRHTSGSFYSSAEDVFDYEVGAQSRSEDEEDDAPFRQVPFSSYVGHSADVLDLAWSKNYFILSSSMDKTVRLWHISRKECLCCFQHIDFVTAIAFHPRDDRYFLSGSLDSKLRLWNIPDKKVALWNEVSPDGSSSSTTASGGALITTVNFCENGKFAVCGTYDGRCIFFDTEHLKYHTQIHVRSSRGRNTKGHKITGIEPLHGEHKILVTSNDSRVRLYDLRDLSLVCKYKGHTNLSSQIKASFSPESKHIICGSEDKCVYIWKTSLPQDVTKLSSFRRDRNDCWESLKAHDAVVTCAVFAPQPQLLYKTNCSDAAQVPSRPKSTSILSLSSKKHSVDEANVIVSADFNGAIKVIVSAE